MSLASSMATKTAVVTGVAKQRGIGRACVRALIQAGYRVVGIDIKQLEGVESDSVVKNSSKFHFLEADLAQEEQIDAVAAKACALLDGRVHVLVNNAGISDPYMPHDAAARRKAWHRYVGTNLTAAFLLTEAVLPHLPPEETASIIHISSTRAVQSEPSSEGYASAKAGLLGLTHSQAVTLGTKARVNAILPGYIHTGDEDPASALSKEDHAWHLTGSVGEPDDIAELVLFLASSRSKFITGQSFTVDGGVTKKMVYPE